jgi:predicted DNA-binding transcriptional regulator AlpA
MSPERLLPKKIVLDRLGCKNTKLYELINSGFLPPPVKLPTASGTPGRHSYWPESVVNACVTAVAQQRVEELRRIAAQGRNVLFGDFQ